MSRIMSWQGCPTTSSFIIVTPPRTIHHLHPCPRTTRSTLLKMSYRVETASSGRAVCSDAVCKAAGVKIELHSLRLGAWVEYGDRGGWQWKHWGCVTGKQLQNLRNYLADPDRPGEYRFDMLDGYESGGKNDLNNHPDFQETVRRAIVEGRIDPEEFNGDPEMNQLGMTGIRTLASKKKLAEDKKTNNYKVLELEAELAVVKAERDALKQTASKKRAKEEDNEDEVFMPAKYSRTRGKKAVKEEPVDEKNGIDKAPAKKAPIKKALAKKGRGKKVVKEEVVEDAVSSGLSSPPPDLEPETPVAARASRRVKSQ